MEDQTRRGNLEVTLLQGKDRDPPSTERKGGRGEGSHHQRPPRGWRWMLTDGTARPSEDAPFSHLGTASESESAVAQSCPTLCDPVDCSPPGSSVHGILQARILEWVAISYSRGSSQPRDWTQVSCIAGRRFNLWGTREALHSWIRRLSSEVHCTCRIQALPWRAYINSSLGQ